MPPPSRTSLPLDVVHTIATLAECADLSSLVLASRRLNELLTPVLYSTIDLGAWDNIAMCLRTLKTPLEQCIYGRNLAGFVRLFRIRTPPTRLPFYVSTSALAEDIHCALSRMGNLRRVSSDLYLGAKAPEILYTLVSGSSPLLRAIEFYTCDECPPLLQGELVLTVPSQLRSFKLNLPAHLPTAQAALLRNLLTECSPTLSTLSLIMDRRAERDFWASVLPQRTTFSSLQALEIDGNALSHPSLAQAVQLHSLNIIHSWERPPASLHDLLPNVKELSCPRQLLRDFLYKTPELRRRPIDTVHIDNIFSEPCDVQRMRPLPARKEPPSGRDLIASFELLQYSSLAVKSLSFEINLITGVALKTIRHYLRDLEYMAISIRYKFYYEKVGVVSAPWSSAEITKRELVRIFFVCSLRI